MQQRLDNRLKIAQAAVAFDDNRGENDAAAAAAITVAVAVAGGGLGRQTDGRREQRLNATGDFDDREEVRELLGLGRFLSGTYSLTQVHDQYISCHSAR